MMRLKSLELQGFKSFPDKTHLSFGDGITAIVGPNGSGKSNISDAVRWVLGEQSTKTLRGSKMEDVIFGGTEKRGPVGYAEVSLTIDNSDGVLATEYNEVTVTRRYYRSGDSEFYINRKAVRLRDIHEMFMDTGLGRDGYSIIGQGRIDEILSLKSEDRREIFEEAAGISKFRHRKEEAERKLNATEENLMRIRDIISELEVQVEPLSKQAEAARRFLQIHDELRGLEIDLWIYQLDKNGEILAKLKNDYQIACSQFERGQMSIEELYAEAERISGEMRAKDLEIEQAKERHFDTERKRDEHKHEISVLNNTIENNDENIRRINEELNDENNRAGSLDDQITQRKTRVSELENQIEKTTTQIDEISKEIQVAVSSSDDAGAKLDALRAESGDVDGRISECQIRQSAIEAELAAASSRIEELNAQKEERLNALESAKEKRAELKASKAEAEETLTSAGNILAGVALKKKKREEKLEIAAEALAKQNGRFQALEHKLNVLKELEKDMEGFSHAVKVIHRAGERGEISGIHGTVAKLIRVSDDYALAIETILGGALQNVVVEDERAAKSGISLLKSGNSGRATFLPLTTIKGNVLKENKLDSHDGFIGIASELVSFDEKYRNIFESLLGRIVVVDHISHATDVARAYGYKFRIVTLDGQIINAGGSYTGGSTAKNAGILSRSNEIEALQKEINSLREQIEKLTSEKNEAEREVNKLAYEAEVYENDKRQAEDILLRVDTELSHCTLLINSAQEGSETLELEIVNERKKLFEREKQQKELCEEIALLSDKSVKISDNINTLILNNSELNEKRSELSEKLSELRESFASARAEQSELERGLVELQSLRDAIAGGNQQKKELICEYEAKNEQIRAQIAGVLNAISEFDQAILGISSEINKLSEEKLALEAKRNKKDKESKDKNDEILNLERERSRLESKITSAENEERLICDRLWDTYELTVSSARESARAIENMSEHTGRVSYLKGEKKKLGNVNLGAIEEYDRVSERYNFLREQHDDLEKAKAELMEKISDITGQMRDIFSEQFKIINQNFSETFSEIFGGGKAELSLDDPDDILNCGIEIRVQPPGKSLRTITLLSGGERAFVAIALYFAIMKVRPTPFCVLDEIEAALDDVNVVRYANYLRKLTKTTQFIVITHRRGTMEEADVLYGVTMQDQGISKMLTISIAEVEHELSMKLK